MGWADGPGLERFWTGIKQRLIPLVVGTQTAATGAWTGVAETITELYDGLTIRYWLPYAGSGNATLNLTLAGGNATGAIPCYYGGTTRLTTHYGAGNAITLTYRVNARVAANTSLTGWWADANYDTNYYDRVRYTAAIKASAAITATNIIVGGSGGYRHLKAGGAFDITYPPMYAASNIAANGTGTGNYLIMYFAIAATQALTLTPYLPVYIKGALDVTMFTPVSTAPLTQDVPASDDGYDYMLLGMAYSATHMYLLSDHTIYRHYAGVFQPRAGKPLWELGTNAEGGVTLTIND